MNNKITYTSPLMELVKIDRELVLLNTSEGTGPDPGGGGAETVSQHNPNSSDKNKFSNNPFEK